ncbi:MAG: hypothetical protein HSCHL_0708 [Hydrogenibacillus schlegelii]|uniref:Uncharacterized protein n=1 Tax=Hydrogenibacillus schlegelii TaxID=1484 RepID=A0A2T5G7T0_HYDSH|nr:hypothetical protein [Hydrogenibacillus schlegelii]PTQ52237.1 MAG: hypothetical protein HSCHL_0708 [Hydrogenibacillus schlegelii]
MGKTGGLTTEQTVWILIAFAVAMILGWIFEKEQITAFVTGIWKDLSGWAAGVIRFE